MAATAFCDAGAPLSKTLKDAINAPRASIGVYLSGRDQVVDRRHIVC